jgi:hypothetical protein
LGDALGDAAGDALKGLNYIVTRYSTINTTTMAGHGQPGPKMVVLGLEMLALWLAGLGPGSSKT